MPMLGSDPGGGADGVAAAEVSALAGRTLAIPLPPPTLSGWSSLCADEYARAARALHAAVLAAATALAQAGRP